MSQYEGKNSFRAISPILHDSIKTSSSGLIAENYIDKELLKKKSIWI